MNNKIFYSVEKIKITEFKSECQFWMRFYCQRENYLNLNINASNIACRLHIKTIHIVWESNTSGWAIPGPFIDNRCLFPFIRLQIIVVAFLQNFECIGRCEYRYVKSRFIEDSDALGPSFGDFTWYRCNHWPLIIFDIILFNVEDAIALIYEIF